MLVSLTTLLKSFRYAVKGFRYVLANEQNFRIQIIASIIVCFLMVYFQVKVWEAVALIIVMGMVLILELVNTIFEKIVDILKPRIHHYVEVIKDIMATAVLMASVGAAIVGIIIFYPYIFGRF